MGRGKSWNSYENETLARAWVRASEDPIARTSQTSETFAEVLRRLFVELGPCASQTPYGRYGNRNAASCKSHFDLISADAQKFSIALRTIRASSPTGVTEDHILSMAVAFHLGRTTKMDYKFKEFDKRAWPVYRAWQVLSARPKWYQSFSIRNGSPDRNEESRAGAAGDTNAASRESFPHAGEDSNDADQEESSGRTSKSSHALEERFKIGSRNAKLVCQEELRTNAVRSMAESAKRKSIALEERNAIAVFSRPEAQNLPETLAFFRALRETYLAKAIKRARVTCEEAVQCTAATDKQANLDTHETNEDRVESDVLPKGN